MGGWGGDCGGSADRALVTMWHNRLDDNHKGSSSSNKSIGSSREVKLGGNQRAYEKQILLLRNSKAHKSRKTKTEIFKINK